MINQWENKEWENLPLIEKARQLKMLPCDGWKIERALSWYNQFKAHKAFNLVSQDIRDRARSTLVVNGDCSSLSDYVRLCNSGMFDVSLGLASSYTDYIISQGNVLVITETDGRSLGHMLPVLPADGTLSLQQVKAIYATACTIKCAKCGKAIVLDHLPDGLGRVCKDCADWEGDYE